MKATGFLELVILVVALVAGLPLFSSCVRMAYNGLGATYMNDKSTWKVQDDVEFAVDASGHLVPVGILEPFNLTAAQIAVMTYTQDEYCPVNNWGKSPLFTEYVWPAGSAQMIDINYDATNLKDISPEKEFTIEEKARASRGVDSTKVVTELFPASSVASSKSKKYYLVWNTKRHRWMITEHCINIYE